MPLHNQRSLRFRRWSRKSYAAFHSIGKHVTIGNLKNIVADTLLGKQKNGPSFPTGNTDIETNGEASLLPEEQQDLMQEIISPVPVRVPAEQANPTRYKFYLWPTANDAVGFFYVLKTVF
ncbi:hypothetical protein ABDK00_000515 [Niabella insulamsoli]|uniref:hypothetical protein n=1 Tax=Niabella insulamsoli TaxID=3144874 RepID=UPI0031FD233C